VRLAWLGIASAALDLGAVYVKVPVLRPGVTWGDLIDIATPFILVFLYALVLRALSVAPSSRTRLLLVVGGFCLILGHGIHVAANSIDDALARAGAADPQGLVDWWDEHVSHSLIHGSKAALCVALTALEARRGAGAAARLSPLLLLGALAYGFIFFADGVEGQTVPILLPFAILYLAWSIGRGRPWATVRLFYTLAAIVSILLFATWGIGHRGFPEFSKVGLVP